MESRNSQYQSLLDDDDADSKCYQKGIVGCTADGRCDGWGAAVGTIGTIGTVGSVGAVGSKVGWDEH